MPAWRNYRVECERRPLASPPETDWPADGLETQADCPVCGSPDRELVHPELRDRIFFCATGRWRMHRCRAGSLHPRPTPATIGMAYEAYYTHAAAAAAPFVKRAQSLGYAAEGLEFDDNAARAAEAAGLNVRQGLLPDTGLESEAYDVKRG
ncbi:hypothetical protein [Methylomagnum sp.]